MKTIAFFITVLFFGYVNSFAEETRMEFRTIRDATFGWCVQRVMDGDVNIVARLPDAPAIGSLRKCVVVRADSKSWIIIYRQAGGVANIYECSSKIFEKDFVPDLSALDTLVPVKTESLRRLSKEWNIRDYAGEYLLFFEENAVLKALPAAFPFGWEKCRERRKHINKNGVVGYNPKMKIWEKVSTRYTDSEEIESFANKEQKRRTAVSEKIGNFTFAKECASKFCVRKNVAGHIFAGTLDFPDFPKSFVEINDTLWCFVPSAFPKKDKFLFRVRVKDGAVVAESLPFPFYFSGTKEQIFNSLDAVMIKKNGKLGIIVPVKFGQGEDRVFWFDENRWAWTEEGENGTKRNYDEDTATSEFRRIREKRGRNRY